jgi:hypothetical protein
VTLRFLRLLAWQLLLTLACALPQAALAAEETVEITSALIEAADEGYRLRANYAFDLSHALEDALQAGISLDFTTEVSFTRRRWYWFPDKAWSSRRTHRIWYDVLTRQYHVKVLGSVQQSYTTMEEALFTIRRPTRWVVAPRSALKAGETYDVTVNMGLDNLPKPFQVNALNNRQWTLSSQRKTFQYKAE